MHHADGSLTVSLNASDPDGDSLPFSAQTVDAEAQLAYDLDQQLGFYVDATILVANHYENYRGAGEKYFKGQGGLWYFIFPNAELHRWGGSIQASPLVATLEASYYDDPTTLHDASIPQPIPVDFWVDPKNATLIISPESGDVGSFYIQVTASDGVHLVSQTFRVTVLEGDSQTATQDDALLALLAEDNWEGSLG